MSCQHNRNFEFSDLADNLVNTQPRRGANRLVMEIQHFRENGEKGRGLRINIMGVDIGAVCHFSNVFAFIIIAVACDA